MDEATPVVSIKAETKIKCLPMDRIRADSSWMSFAVDLQKREKNPFVMQPDLVSLYTSVEGQEWPGGGWKQGLRRKVDGCTRCSFLIKCQSIMARPDEQKWEIRPFKLLSYLSIRNTDIHETNDASAVVLALAFQCHRSGHWWPMIVFMLRSVRFDFSPGGKQLSPGLLDDSPAGWCRNVMFSVNIRNANATLIRAWITAVCDLNVGYFDWTYSVEMSWARLWRIFSLPTGWFLPEIQQLSESAVGRMISMKMWLISNWLFPQIFHLAFSKLLILKSIDWLIDCWAKVLTMITLKSKWIEFKWTCFHLFLWWIEAL